MRLSVNNLFNAVLTAVVLFFVVAFITSYKPVAKQADNANLPVGSTLVWVRGEERAYRLAGCLWFDRLDLLDGNWKTETQNGAPIVFCQAPAP